MTKDEALKLALKALESNHGEIVHDWALVEKNNQAITAIKEALANEALDRKAENARELGLDYEPDLNLSCKSVQARLATAWGYVKAEPEQEPVSLRRGDILRCIETDELCTVWSTSTTGKTLIKWSANDFGAYTAEQIGELFWLEPEPDDLELAAEKSDNYAAFHAGYRFAVARGNTGDNT